MAVPFDPHHLTPEQRLDELTAILAIGARRLLALRVSPAISALPPPPEQIPSESCQNCLMVSPQSRLHGTQVVNATREPQRRCT